MSHDYEFEGWLGHGETAAEGQMEWGTFEPKKRRENDVDIQVTHCGVCGTDIHVLRSDWSPTPYPCCVGHELVGKAVRVGSLVKNIKVGDRVGVGPQAQSCERPDCYECSSGQMNYCPLAVATYGAVYPDGKGKSYGGFGNYNRTNSSFVFKIPDGLASEDAAPMLCAGITMYAPLKKYGCRPGKKVGIVGIGGLGHFGILFAKALEADRVIAISRKLSKREDALALGADKYTATEEDGDWRAENRRSLDVIVLTASSPDMPINQYLELFKCGGTLVQLGAHAGGEFPPFSALTLLFNGLNIAGGINGSPEEMRDMLDLAAKKQIKPWIQTMPMEDANQALVDLEAGKPRYRLVLVNSKNASEY
ncbi:putative nadp-dependent alcohol dehydrogenase protein [Ilyonectria robusta]